MYIVKAVTSSSFVSLHCKTASFLRKCFEETNSLVPLKLSTLSGTISAAPSNRRRDTAVLSCCVRASSSGNSCLT